MHSLQARLSAGLIIALVVLVGLLLLIGSYTLHHLAEEFVATRLEHDMEALLGALRFDKAGSPMLRRGRLNPVFHQPYSGHYYKIRTATSELRSRSLWDTDLSIPNTTAKTTLRYFSTGPENQRLLVLVGAFRVRGRELTLAVTEDWTPLAAGLRQLTIGVALAALVLLGTSILAQRLIVRQGLKPLEETRRDILRLARGEIRQLRGDAPAEIQPLVDEINRLIELMGQRLQRSRHALGNLAHALKTPLTVLTQLGAQPPGRPLDALCEEVSNQTRQIRSLVERELKRARIAGAPTPGQRIVLAQEVADLSATLKKIHRDKALAIECRVPSHSPFPGDRDDLLELLGNLLDNACKWAAGHVRLTVTEAADLLRFTIEDDGPGCTAERLELLTRRGTRVDESRAGHGLGLAIVTDIVEQYEGRLHLGRSPEMGGFLAQVELPRPDVPNAP